MTRTKLKSENSKNTVKLSVDETSFRVYSCKNKRCLDFLVLNVAFTIETPDFLMWTLWLCRHSPGYYALMNCGRTGQQYWKTQMDNIAI